jgi:hypothetical protein
MFLKPPLAGARQALGEPGSRLATGLRAMVGCRANVQGFGRTQATRVQWTYAYPHLLEGNMREVVSCNP